MSSASSSATGLTRPMEDPVRFRALGLIVVFITNLMLVVDTNIVNVALPDIRTDLHFSAANLSWVVTGYALAFAGFILLSGKIGAIVGARRALIAGTALFIVASAAGGFAASPEFLVIARIVQGVGAAIAAPSTLVLLAANTEPGPQRTQALALFVLARGSGGAIGLILGGLLTTTLGWESVMFVNVPIGIAIILGAIFFLTETPRASARLDYPGAIATTVGMTALVYGFTEAAGEGWTDVRALISFVIVVVSFGALILVERDRDHAVVPLRLFTSRQTLVPFLGMLLAASGMYAFFYFMTLFSQDVFQYSPLRTGLALIPFVVPLIATSQATPKLMPILGERVIGTAGLAAIAAGLFWLGAISSSSSYLGGVFGPALLIGTGVGLSLAPITGLVMHFAPAAVRSEASSMLQAMQQLGGSIGVAILTSIYVHGRNDGGEAHGIALALVGGGLFAAIAVVLFTLWGSRIGSPARHG